MKRRKALSVLNRDNTRYWQWSYTRLAGGGYFGALWPRNYGLYRRACVTLKREPYYDKQWYLEHKRAQCQLCTSC